MGFCLFEDADFPGSFVALNSNYIEDIEEAPNAQGALVCRVRFTVPLAHDGVDINLRIIGQVEEIWALLKQASKIGLGKAKLHLMNKLSARPIPLLINQPDRIMMVRELQPEEFMNEDSSLITASRLFFQDGKNRYISERPGTFVSLTNAGRKTPILKAESA